MLIAARAADMPAVDRHSSATPTEPAPPRSDPMRPRSRNTYKPGDVIDGRYILDRVLGEGGMGSVWAAYHERLAVPIALKLIRRGLQSSPREQDLRSRFLQEARLAARLDHESIIKVFDYGHTRRGDPFLVMELLDGEDLGELLAREGPLDPVRAVRLLLPVADALRTAHDHLIVHRDLKPDNIFIAEVGEDTCPKILDFGVARSLGPGSVSRLTQSGTPVGSPEYMAPEQAAGLDDIDGRADVWGLCAVLYECVTGSPPFPLGDKSYERLLRDIQENAPPTFEALAVREDALWAIVERGLRKDRSERYQTIGKLGEVLARWLVTKGLTEDIRGRSLRARWNIEPESIAPVSRPTKVRLRRMALASLFALAAGSVGHVALTGEATWFTPKPEPAGIAEPLAAGVVPAIETVRVETPVDPLNVPRQANAQAREMEASTEPDLPTSDKAPAKQAPPTTTTAKAKRAAAGAKARKKRDPHAPDESEFRNTNFTLHGELRDPYAAQESKAKRTSAEHFYDNLGF